MPPQHLLLLSLSPADDDELVIKAAPVRITFKVLYRSIHDIISCSVFPEQDVQREEYLVGLEEKVAGLNDLTTLIGISVMSNDYALFVTISSRIRTLAPACPIVAGGPHFVHTFKAGGTTVTGDSTIERALHRKHADAVIAGQGGPLRSLVMALRQGDAVFRSGDNRHVLSWNQGKKPDGLFHLDNDCLLAGTGIGKRPHITSGNPYIVPLQFHDGIGANFNISNRCPNQCSYCGSPKFGYDLPVSSYLDELDATVPGHDISVLQVNDNHPFERHNRNRTIELLEAIGQRQEGKPRLLNVFLDPSILLEPDAEEVVSFLQSYGSGAHQFQFGRECTDESVSLPLGRHYRNKPRNQERLDGERNAIRTIAHRLPNARFKVFYIFTPFESHASVQKTIDEAVEFLGVGNIGTGSNLLWCLPGSLNRAKYREKFFSFEDIPLDLSNSLSLVSPGSLNFWSPKLPGSRFLDLLMGTQVKVYVEPLRPRNTWYHLSMMKVLSSLAFGLYQPGETVSRVIAEIPALPRQLEGDIEPDFIDRIASIGHSIDTEGLADCTDESIIRLSTLVREIFWFFTNEQTAQLAEELRLVFRFRREWFGRQNNRCVGGNETGAQSVSA